LEEGDLSEELVARGAGWRGWNLGWGGEGVSWELGLAAMLFTILRKS
jgi:hypothetical protein